MAPPTARPAPRSPIFREGPAFDPMSTASRVVSTPGKKLTQGPAFLEGRMATATPSPVLSIRAETHERSPE